jgi:PLP dependent protein
MTVAERVDETRVAIADAAVGVGRDPEDVTLVAISKFHDETAIGAALACGHRVFGESRVQEAARKWPALRAAYPDVRLHLVGQLQTNKARAAVRLFDVIQTVDRVSLAQALAAAMAAEDQRPRCLIQVNVGDEPQKAGVSVDGLAALLDVCTRDLGLPVRGLMCIPPAAQDPVPHFQLLHDLTRRHGLPVCSMGMTADYPTAIACGATHVRVGQGIFGPRVG